MAESSQAQAPASAPAQEEKLYTLETLKQHGTRESMWMLLHDKVYDITKFMDEVS
jgi:cytochrome b involved in lipid metabolism